MDNNFSNQFNSENGEKQESNETYSNPYFDNSNYQDFTDIEAQYRIQEEQKTSGSANGMQIASMVFGILGVLFCCCYGVFAILFGLIGLILAVLGNKKNPGNGIGIAGLVLSIISLILGTILVVYLVYCILLVSKDPALQSQVMQIFRENGINIAK